MITVNFLKNLNTTLEGVLQNNLCLEQTKPLSIELAQLPFLHNIKFLMLDESLVFVYIFCEF